MTRVSPDMLDDCPVMVTIGAIAGKWKPSILWVLRDGPRRFSELRRQIDGASEKMLAQHLQSLEDDNIITRREFFDGGVAGVEYAYTDYGRTLIPALNMLGEWGARHLALRGEDIGRV
jgi:DNA-binding HxlR family transcriptional regulator